MKKNTYLTLISAFYILFFFSCSESENCESNAEKVDFVASAIELNNTTNTQVNDTLWVSLKIPNKLNDIEGNVHTLTSKDILHLPNRIFIKKNNSTYDPLKFIEIIQDFGEIQIDEGLLTLISNYDNSSGSFKYKIGLVISERGTYQLSINDTGLILGEDKCGLSYFSFALYFKNTDPANNQIYIFTVN